MSAGWALGWAGAFEHRFDDAFATVGAGTIDRERTRTLPYEAVEALRASGFTRASVPEEFGGLGAGPAEMFELLARLGAEDSNLPQIFRSHFALVDRLVATPDDPRRDRILRLIGEGAVFGNASHERSSAQVGSLETKLTAHEGGWLLDGTKYYSTGTLFADWVAVSAETPAGEHVGVITATDAPGVRRVDDWTGFGQKLTGSGTTLFERVPVEERDIQRRGGPARVTHDAAFLQLVLVASADGIGRAIVRDAIDFVQRRTRVYSHGSGDTARQDPIVQETLGELEALSFQAAAAVRAAALAIAAASRASASADDAHSALTAAANEATTAAQLVAFPAVLRAASLLFEVGGASATDAGRALDRHWRNARTIASHNPARYKARALGDALLNGADLTGFWSTGESASAS